MQLSIWFHIYFILPALAAEWTFTQLLVQKNKKDDIKNENIAPVIIPPGGNDFRVIIEKSSMWIDKSLLMEYFWKHVHGHSIYIITAPPKWGKTTNLQMIKYYCALPIDFKTGYEYARNQSPAYKYFVLGEIWDNDGRFIDHTDRKPLIHNYPDNDKYLANYLVIELSGLTLDVGEGILSFEAMVRSAYRDHKYLVERWLTEMKNTDTVERKQEFYNKIRAFERFSEPVSDIRVPFTEPELANSVVMLCEMLFDTYGKKIVIIYDEYDKWIQQYYLDAHSPYYGARNQEQFLNFLQKFMLQTFKNNKYLEMGFITGILSVEQAAHISGLTHVYKSSVFDKTNLFPFYGLFEPEFKFLANEKNLSSDFTQWIIDNYDGYRIIGHLETPMYSMFSLTRKLSSGDEAITTDYVKMGLTQILVRLFKLHPRIRDEMQNFIQLVNGNPAFIKIRHDWAHVLDIKHIDLISKLLHSNEITYSPKLHKCILFAFLIQIGLATVDPKSQETSAQNYGEDADSPVFVKVPNNEIRKFLNLQIVTTHPLYDHSTIPPPILLRRYMDGDNDSYTIPPLGRAISEYLFNEIGQTGFVERNEENSSTLIDDCFGNERTAHNFIFLFFQTSFPISDRYYLKSPRMACEFNFVTAHLGKRYIDAYVQEHNTILILGLGYEKGDSLKKAFEQALSYAFIFKLYDIRYPFAKFMAMRVHGNVKVEIKAITLPTNKISSLIYQWINNTSCTNDTTRNYDSWKSYILKNIPKDKITYFDFKYDPHIHRFL